MKKLSLIIATGFTLGGCASMFSSETQPVKVNALVNNKPQPGLMCSVQNGRGSWATDSGESYVVIRRDSRPLAVNCYNQDKTLVGTASVPSYYNTTNLWNIPLTLIPAAGIAGWVLDGTNGTANEYPHEVDVNMFPKTLNQ